MLVVILVLVGLCLVCQLGICGFLIEQKRNRKADARMMGALFVSVTKVTPAFQAFTASLASTKTAYDVLAGHLDMLDTTLKQITADLTTAIGKTADQKLARPRRIPDTH